MSDYLQLILLIISTLVFSKWIGAYIYKVMDTDYIASNANLFKLEQVILKSGASEDSVTSYFQKMILINIIALIATILCLKYQHFLPTFNSDAIVLNWTQASNIAISFVTTTDWQAYSGENTLSLFSQTIVLGSLMFFGAATGLCMAIALSRAIANHGQEVYQYSFYQDFVRSILWILLPLSIAVAIFFVSQGVVQSLISYVTAHTITGEEQKIPLGLVASYESIKFIGGNGGGYFGANSAHPFENPNIFTNFVQILSGMLIPGALTIYYGKITNNMHHGWVILIAMLTIVSIGIMINYHVENRSISELYLYEDLNIDEGNMEGKETRFGIMGSAMFAQTASAATGAANSIHGSFTPLGGLAILSNLLLGGITFGGCGNGFAAILFNIILATFISGLMVGRTPTYLGKKILPVDIKYIMIYQVSTQIIIIIGITFLILNQIDTATYDIGTQGISRALYNLSSAAYNNGSSFLSVRNNLLEYQHLISILMLIGRYMLIYCTAKITYSFINKNYHYSAYNSLRTDRNFFIVIIIIAAVNSSIAMFPFIVIGPIAEHLTIHH